jgi:hypothetical protein
VSGLRSTCSLSQGADLSAKKHRSDAIILRIKIFEAIVSIK